MLKYGYSQSDIAKFYNVSTGKAYYIVQEARAFKLSDLEFYIDKLAELDYQIKSGKLDKTIGLELLLLKLPKEKLIKDIRLLLLIYAIAFNALAKRDFWRAA